MRFSYFCMVLSSVLFITSGAQEYCQRIMSYNVHSSDERAVKNLLDALEQYALIATETDFYALVDCCNTRSVLPMAVIRLFHAKYTALLGMVYNSDSVEVASELMCFVYDWEAVMSYYVWHGFTKQRKIYDHIFQVCVSSPYQFLCFYRLTLAQALKIFYFIYKRGDISSEYYPERVAALYQKIKMVTSCF